MNSQTLWYWVALVGVLVIPALGFTARFALKPIVEAIIRLKEAFPAAAIAPQQEQRLASLEAELHQVHALLERVLERREFDAQLSGTADRAPARLPGAD